MIPAIDPADLHDNPKFAKLLKILAKEFLTLDGSTRDDYWLATRDETAKLAEVIPLVAARLTTRLSDEDRDLLQDDVDFFMDDISEIGRLVSDRLTQDVVSLSSVVSRDDTRTSPDQHPSARHPAEEITSRRAHIAELETDISRSRTSIANTTSSILELYTALLERSIRILEQTKLGTMTRGVKAQSTHLAAVAQALDSKMLISKAETESQIYTPAARNALQSYSGHLQRTQTLLHERIQAATSLLRQYQGVSGGGEGEGEMMPLVARYKALLEDGAALKADLARLSA
ncbi:MAG: hypothetical protein M1838_004779 [Thelocarpon superellum]|nr:MAG: hypothetical protein M1838_004779 [Thelocarpon superellum]